MRPRATLLLPECTGGGRDRAQSSGDVLPVSRAEPPQGDSDDLGDPVPLQSNRRYLYAGRGLRSFSTAFLTVIFPLYLVTRGYSTAKIGLVLTLGGFTTALLLLAVGLFADRIGRRQVLLVLAGLGVIGAAGLAISTSLGIVMVANGLCGVGRGGGAGSGGSWGPVFPAEQPLVASSASSGRERTAVFGRLSFIGVLTGALGSLVAFLPDLLHQYGWSWVASYQAVFGLGGLVALLAVGVTVPIREAGRRDRTRGPTDTHPLVNSPATDSLEASPSSNVEPLTTRQLVARLGLTNALNGLGFGFLGPLLTLWFALHYHVGPGSIGLLYAVVNLLAALPYLGSAKLVERIGTLRTITFSRIAGLAVLAGMMAAPTFLIAGGLFALRMGLNSLGLPARQSFVMGAAPERRRSAVAAYSMLPTVVAGSVSPVLGGVLMASFLDTPIVGAILFMGANVVAFALAFRNHQPEEEADLRARRAERRHARSRASPEPSDSSSPSSSGTLQPR